MQTTKQEKHCLEKSAELLEAAAKQWERDERTGLANEARVYVKKLREFMEPEPYDRDGYTSGSDGW